MRTLKFPRQHDYMRYPDDIIRIVRVCKEHGYYISDWDAQMAWDAHSDSFAASWLFLPDGDQELYDTVLSLCEQGEEDDE